MAGFDDGFGEQGFLADGITAGVVETRSENAAWFQLAADTNRALMRATVAGTEVARGTNWSREAVAVKSVIHKCEAFNLVLLLTLRDAS